MNVAIIFILFLFKFCESAYLYCGRWDHRIESVEFYCSNFEGMAPVDCSSSFSPANVTDKSKVTHLKIGGCDHHKIKRFVEECPNLYSLDISSSGLENFDSLYDQEFELKHDRLVKLNASHNHFTKISKLQLPAATEIDFSYNKICEINILPAKLVKIHLKHAGISTFDGESFVNLTDLEYIDLSWSNISNFRGTLRSNTKLKTLRLDGNSLWGATDLFVTLKKTEVSVYLSWALVKNLYWKLLVTNDMRVIVNSNKEGIFYASDGSRADIHCNENSFNRINVFQLGNNFENPTEMLRCLPPSLQVLKLGDCVENLNQSNVLKKFTNLKHLYINNSKLNQLDLNVVKDLKSIMMLEIKGNENLRQIDNVRVLERENPSA